MDTPKKPYIWDQPRLTTVGGSLLVYTSGAVCFTLSDIANALAENHTEKTARRCVTLVHQINRAGGSPDFAWTAPISEVRRAIEQVMTQHYGVRLRVGVLTTHLLCEGTTKPATIIAILTFLKQAFAAIAALGLRIDQPMETVRCARAQLSRYSFVQRQVTLYDGTLSRTPVGYYRVQAGVVIPVGILDNPGLPEYLRARYVAARLKWRDVAIIENLHASGVRVTEGVELTWASINPAGLDAPMRLHTKGQGRVPRKPVVASEQTKHAMTRYFLTEQPAHDPRYPDFLVWLRKRAATHARYLQYLHARQIDPSTVPVFWSERKTPYNSAAFWQGAWSKLRNGDAGHLLSEQMIASPHHLRHWRINVDLDELQAKYAHSEIQLIAAALEYVRVMGWRSWRSLIHYDHRGLITFLLQQRDQRGGPAESVPVQHGIRNRLSEQGLLPVALGAG
ncbi:hypothetical protein [Deinococcus sp. QL22]|uniref:hypothetical protein n=1 Tax=Deinococcus sp. QL22 TaxID=2939437 RepID=UPI002017F6AF|nr:hypothetical protein [Deinococcus sp. QL22]UQN10217.1 hypothetical protein M1R55_27970 [Deinococcus sp. QL22]